MKQRKLLTTLAIALALICGLTIGASAADTLKEISAYLNYGITVQYNGEAQTLKSADGSTIYPITYNGTTYLPVRAIGNIFGVPVDWDQATQTVLLGGAGSGIDLIENFEPYTGYARDSSRYADGNQFLQNKDKKSRSIGGETVGHWIGLRYASNIEPRPCSFNLGGKYNSLTFKVYSESDITLYVKGDNESILGQFDLKGEQVPQTFTVDLHNTTQLTFDCDKIPTVSYYSSYGHRYTYIFNAILE